LILNTKPKTILKNQITDALLIKNKSPNTDITDNPLFLNLPKLL